MRSRLNCLFSSNKHSYNILYVLIHTKCWKFLKIFQIYKNTWF
ncbi:383L [Invertebrate iridescent virus Kaz2018]|uniref:383L n=1 Tax=Invertebrate iridescent virus 6 TaxID=176652 RepID=Q91FE1_IIV6|nr:383L [Invertebrate iridescent virus 6]AAK82243.1 383L [Invertebrate iridescent virus 6]QMS79758.1 hypothetical protein IIV6-T1_376 [Invertebrate iridescent virus 6]QNH08793.1 383L [Invertebrate iridescent virus Kaz2018]